MPQSRVSQHLSALRSFGVVEAEAEGREQFYRLRQPQMARWIADGIDFVAHRVGSVTDEDIASARAIWGLDDTADSSETGATRTQPPKPGSDKD